MKTPEEILANTKKYTRKNHGPNAHLKPQNYFFLQEDVSKAMKEYAKEWVWEVVRECCDTYSPEPMMDNYLERIDAQ